MKSVIISTVMLSAMVVSILALRWTHDDLWFFAFVISLIVFLLSAGDLIRFIVPNRKFKVPPSVHVFSGLLFVLGILSSVKAWGGPETTVIQLLFIPFFMPACVYVVYFYVRYIRFPG